MAGRRADLDGDRSSAAPSSCRPHLPPGQAVDTRSRRTDDARRRVGASSSSMTSWSGSPSTVPDSSMTPSASPRADGHLRQGHGRAGATYSARRRREHSDTVHAGMRTMPLDVYRFLRDESAPVHPIHPDRRAGGRSRPGWNRPVALASASRVRAGERWWSRPGSVTPEVTGRFIDVFDEWVRRDVGDGLRPDVRLGARPWAGSPAVVRPARPAAPRSRSSTPGTSTRATTSSNRGQARQHHRVGT